MSLVRRSNVFDPFSMDLWDPFDTMFRSIVPSATSTNSETAAFASARIDWKETPGAHRSREKEDKDDKWHRVERSSGQFVRRFRLPENAKVDQVKAGLENGVLTVTVPKAEEKKPEVKAIEISG
ncbi:heat shock protein17.2 [Zea mays]|uniref:Heat shock protein17.2 n=1 Tax=Zea mays TaxID=4577 RepID=A0A1D6MLV8_MAIZE|nr:heat shock protein17.2 [Zea mays]